MIVVDPYILTFSFAETLCITNERPTMYWHLHHYYFFILKQVHNKGERQP